MLERNEKVAVQRRMNDMACDQRSPVEQFQYDCSHREHCLRIHLKRDADVYDAIVDVSKGICDAVGQKSSDLPAAEDGLAPKRVFTNGPVVGVVWTDGKKTMTRCDEDDPFNLNVGLMNNYLRKVTRNRGRYDLKWGDAERCAVVMAETLKTPEDMVDAARALEFLADARKLLGGQS